MTAIARNAWLLALTLSLAATAASAQGIDIATYRNPLYGFSISYPTAHFTPQEPLAAEGRVWVSADGSAKLLAGGLPNEGGLSLREYRELVLRESYQGAEVDYAPVRDTWFVLSGVRDGTIFYERVTFTCGGRVINSWALLYPQAERRRYDRVVEQVARSYRAGAGNCGYYDGFVSVVSGLDGHWLWKVAGQDFSGESLGYSVSGAGDWNADGTPDVVAGAPWADGGEGRVRLYSGVDGALLYSLSNPYPESSNNCGYSVSGIEDLNADGHDEVIVSFRGAGGGSSGRVNRNNRAGSRTTSGESFGPPFWTEISGTPSRS